MRNQNIKKIISFLLRIFVSVIILSILFKKMDINTIFSLLLNINKLVLSFVFLLMVFSYFLGYLRWRMLLKGVGLTIGWFLIFRSLCLGLFFNLFFPSTIGGDLSRSVDLGVRLQQPRLVIASVILDRLSGSFALVFIALFALLIGANLISDIRIFLIIALVLILLLGVLGILFSDVLFSKSRSFLHFFGKFGENLSKLHYEIYNFRNQKTIILKSFLYSLFIQLTVPSVFYLLSLAFGVRINVLYFFILVPIISLIAALPISIAGLGLREASSMYFFSRVGMSEEIAVSLSLLSCFIFFLIGLAGGVIYVVTFFNRRIQHNKTDCLS